MVEYLQEFKEGLVTGTFFDVEGQRQHLEGVSADRPVVLRHVIEQCVLVRQVIVGFHLCIDAPLIRDVGLLMCEDVQFGLFLFRKSGVRLIGLLVFILNLELSQDLEMPLLLPLGKDEVVLSEVFTQQAWSLTWLGYGLAAFIEYRLREEVPPPSCALEELEDKWLVVALAHETFVMAEVRPLEV